MKKNWFWIVLAGAILIVVSPVILLLLAIITGTGGHYKAPSESMAPAINVGDHFFVNKMKYRFSDTNVPMRGDVVVFENPKTQIVMIKRVVGLPGDTLKMQSGRLFLNEKLVPRKKYDSFLYRDNRGGIIGVDKFEEDLPYSRKPHFIFEQTDQGRLDNTTAFKVPIGHIFLMGDNRDNSADSRAEYGPGFVPIENIIGEASYIMFQSKKCLNEENLYCPPFRAMKKL